MPIEEFCSDVQENLHLSASVPQFECQLLPQIIAELTPV
jgi:hypothetical protein